MKLYRITVTGDKYPTDYNIEASSWATAISRAVREWQKQKGKGSRTDELKVRALRTTSIIRDTAKE